MHTHRMDCSTLTPVRAAGAHDGRHRVTCPSSRNPSTIDPDHARKRRHHRARDARCDLYRRHHARRGCGAWQRVGARRGQQQPPQLPQRPRSGGSVASSPGADRMQPEAARGDRVAMRGGLAREDGLDGRFGHFCAIGHVGGLGYRNLLQTPADVRAPVWRVCIALSTVCGSLAGAHVLLLC